MSHEDFYGRPLSQKSESFYFDLCEVCLQRTPSWLEAVFDGKIHSLRFTCDECHTEADNTTVTANRAIQAVDTKGAARPNWVQDFIDSSNEDGELSMLESQSEDKLFGNVVDADNQVSPQSGQAILDASTTEGWTSDFVSEALFGLDIVGWLRQKGAYDINQLASTISTLITFSTNDMAAVKLSAVQCLAEIANIDQSLKDSIKNAIGMFTTDADASVSKYANEVLNVL